MRQESDLYDPALQILREEIFLANVCANDLIHAVHSTGTILLRNGSELHVPRVLFDSGALGASYISGQFVKCNETHLKSLMQECNGSVKLASEQHTVSLKHFVVLTICFKDADDVTNQAAIQFFVLDALSTDMIVGLPAIVQHFSDIFIRMIRDAAAQSSLSYVQNTLSPDLLPPWSNQLEEAPEDIDTPLPCSFTDYLNFMEQTYEEALKEYLGQLEEHTFQAFRDSTDIIQLLQSKKAIGVFVRRTGMEYVVLRLTLSGSRSFLNA